MRNVYVFKTSPGWDYCGGMAVAIAPSFERAVELLQAKSADKHEFYTALQDIPGLTARAYEHGRGWFEVPLDDPRVESFEDDRGWDKWLLVKTIPTLDDQPEEAWMDYNYA